MTPLTDPTCDNPYCGCDQPCQCADPCTCNLELVGEETVTRWDAQAGVLVHSVVTKYAPKPEAARRTDL